MNIIAPCVHDRFRYLCLFVTVLTSTLGGLDVVAEEVAPLGHWRVTGEMHERREYGGGVVLLDGRVLAVSGHPVAGESIASAELYDPETEKWEQTRSLIQARNSGNMATLLKDGRVLLAGGHSNEEVVTGAEIYDPATGQWSNAGSLSVGRDPTATRLADGRVLVSGGINWYIRSGKVYDVCELLDPQAGQWSVTGSLRTPRNTHRTALLDDGRVLAVAGYQDPETLLASAELYDPTTGQWELTGELPEPRAWFSIVKLQDGCVLVAGGYTGTPRKRTYLSSAVIYDPDTEKWSTVAPMGHQRAGCPLIELPDGHVLVTGGIGRSGLEMKSAELYDPKSDTWRDVASMDTGRRNHRTALLPDGSVLVIGGSYVFGSSQLTNCEIFSR
ncbi:MAG: hypothetical protein KDA93_01030 [Planctomycetaceae bacterium]|nr:hypothetical protein [Planctomycetaceae bacterium]